MDKILGSLVILRNAYKILFNSKNNQITIKKYEKNITFSKF